MCLLLFPTWLLYNYMVLDWFTSCVSSYDIYYVWLLAICRSIVWERTVKKLRLSKALTIPEATTISDACRRMAARRVDAVLLTDSNAMLSGIVTDKVLIS